RTPQTCGITLEAVTAAEDEPPITVQGCRFSELRVGVRVSGLADDLKTQLSTGQVMIRDNRLDAMSSVGIDLLGQLDRVHVVGNVVANCRGPGVELTRLFDTTRGIVVANNTLSECDAGVLVSAAGTTGGPTDVRVQNNLILRPKSTDIGVVDTDAPVAGEPGPGDGAALAARWSIGNNWREPPT